MKQNVTLIGGRLDGATAKVEDTKNSFSLHEVDNKTNLKTGRHLIYERISNDRFEFKGVMVDSFIVELVDGPLKGSKVEMPMGDGCVLFRCIDGSIAAYGKKEDKMTFLQAFLKDQEGDAEAFAKDVRDKEEQP